MAKKGNEEKTTGVSQVDVAKRAGLSQPVVSRAFTPGANISDKNREKVLAAARELGYRPNAIARSLVTQRTNMIAIVVIDIAYTFYSHVIAELIERLQEKGYWGLLFKIVDIKERDSILLMALEYQVDGIIITPDTLSPRMADECAARGIPVVLFNCYSPNVDSVCCDNIAACRAVADFLLDTRHERIAYVAGDRRRGISDRERGFTERLQERGCPLTFRECGDYSYDSGRVAARRLLQDDNPPDAVFCANDYMAFAALTLARQELGINVPKDLAIIGFDDVPMASWPEYALTTVKQPLAKLVDSTIESLMNAIESSNHETAINMIPATLVERGTTRHAG